jgi:phytanoyl-CoA hydroxylase
MRFDTAQMDADQFLREDRDDTKGLIDTAVLAELAPGDVLFFDAGLLHAAGANTTDERKLSMVTTYYGADNAPIAGTRSARLDPIHVRAAQHA